MQLLLPDRILLIFAPVPLRNCCYYRSLTYHPTRYFTRFRRYFRLRPATDQSILLSRRYWRDEHPVQRRDRRIALFPAQFRQHRKVSVNQRLNEFTPFPAPSGKPARDLLSVIFTSRRDTPLLSHLSHRQDGYGGGGGGGGRMARRGPGSRR